MVMIRSLPTQHPATRHECKSAAASLRRGSLLSLFLALLFTSSTRVHAVVFYSTGDPDYNTTEPAAGLTGSGWQFQGRWGDFLGTPIAANLFLTARHIGGSIGDSFIYRGRTYHTLAFYDDSSSDLRIWRVCGTFPEWAPLYDKSNELNHPAVIFGRGTQRGAEVRVSSGVGGELKGWQWGNADGVLRWGENTVGSILTSAGLTVPFGGGNPSGVLLKFPFNATGGVNEAHLTGGDSGGAVFILDGSTWKLAGIHYAVDGPYNHSNSGPGFQASLFDEGGLYRGGEGSWSQVTDVTTDSPGAFYSTRVSARLTWINGITATESSLQPSPTVWSTAALGVSFTLETSAIVLPAQGIATVPLDDPLRYYQLRHCHPLRIEQLTLDNGDALLRFSDPTDGN